YSFFFSSFFFFNDPSTTEIYTLSLHDALPIYVQSYQERCHSTLDCRVLQGPSIATFIRADPIDFVLNNHRSAKFRLPHPRQFRGDRKSTRLNSSHVAISYAVFCLKKKKNKKTI